MCATLISAVLSSLAWPNGDEEEKLAKCGYLKPTRHHHVEGVDSISSINELPLHCSAPQGYQAAERVPALNSLQKYAIFQYLPIARRRGAGALGVWVLA